MPQNPDSFKNILLICQDENHPHYNYAWKLLIDQYKETVYNYCYHYTIKWSFPGLRIRIHPVINDIVAEVFIVLVRKINNYKKTDNEAIFKYWLKIICKHRTSYYLQKYFRRPVIFQTDFSTNKEKYVLSTLWETWEELILKLRLTYENTSPKSERDIHVFMLSVFKEFNIKFIKYHPLLKDTDESTLRMIIHRLKEKVKKNVTLLQ